MSAKLNGSTPFAELVREAAKIEREIQQLSSLGGQKLTAAAFLREAMEVARIDAARLKKLRSQIEGGASPGIHDVVATLRRMVRAARSANYPAPPRTMRPLRYMMTPDATAELAKLGASAFDLFALAALIAAEKYPDEFGEAESSDQHNARLLELTLKRDQLFARIGASYRPDDLLLSDWDAEGRCRAGFALSGGAVSIVPREDAPRRLVDWVLAHGTG